MCCGIAQSPQFAAEKALRYETRRINSVRLWEKTALG